MAGQDWDLFSPLNGYTLNIVSVAYQAGLVRPGHSRAPRALPASSFPAAVA